MIKHFKPPGSLAFPVTVNITVTIFTDTS